MGATDPTRPAAGQPIAPSYGVSSSSLPAAPPPRPPVALDTPASSNARALRIATVANTLGLTAHSTYMYYLAPIALRAAGITDRDALIFSLVAVAMGIAVVPAGRLADRIPRRYVFRVGLALLGSSYVSLLVPLGLTPIVLGTIASGVGLAFLFVSFQSYVADLLRAEERTGAYARSTALGILATAAGPFLAAVVLRTTPSQAIGLHVNALLFLNGTLAAVTLTLLLTSARVPGATPTERGRWTDAVRAAGPVAAVYLLMGAGYGMSNPYFTIWFLDSLQYADDSWGYLLAAGTLASALGAILAGKVARQAAPMRVALVGVLGLLTASLTFILPVAAFVFAGAFIVRSLFQSAVSPGMNTLLMSRARSGRRAETQAYGSLAWNAGWAVGGAVGGALLAALGGGVFVVGGVLALLGVFTGVTLLKRVTST